MGWLMAVLLLGAAYLVLESGMTFIALLLFLVALLSIFTEKKAESATAGGAAGAQRPVIVTSTGGKIPEKITIVTKNPWAGTTLGEDSMIYLGGSIENVVRTFVRIFTGKRGTPFKHRQMRSD